MGKKKRSSSEIILETTITQNEGISIAKDDHSDEQFSQLRPPTISLGRSIGLIIRIEVPSGDQTVVSATIDAQFKYCSGNC